MVACAPSTFELDGLTRFAVTEDVEPLHYHYDPDGVEVGPRTDIREFYGALWSESIAPNEYLKGTDVGSLSARMAQGRGALLNRFSDARYERERLRRHSIRVCGACAAADNAGSSPQRSLLCSASYGGVKHCLDELLFWLKYEGGNGDTDASEEERDERKSMTTTTGVDRSSALPRLTACLSLILMVLLSKHSSAERICKDITDTFEDTFGPALDLLAENLPSWSNGGGRCHPADLLAVFGHLHGIVRVLTIAAALGDKDAAIPRMFGSRAKSRFIMCNSLLKEHRNGMCTSGSFD